MTPARRVSAVVIIAAVLVVGGGILVLDYSSIPPGRSSQKSTSTESTGSSLASTSTNSTGWTVINSDATVYGNLACEDTLAMIAVLSCPPTSPGAKSPSLNVEIISYKGELLYDANVSGVVNGQPIDHTIWFTNQTIFCVSPRIGEYIACPVHPVEATITFSPLGTSTSTTSASNGLRLDLQLSTNSSESLFVTVDEYNTLDSVDNVTAASDWPIPVNETRNVCDNYIIAYAVYEGDYGASNLTGGSPLDLNDPGAFEVCAAFSPSAQYSFSPLSDKAFAPAGIFSPVPTFGNITLSDFVSGSYTGTGLSPVFNPFPPGTYTVVAEDQWGDLAMLQFVVTN